MVIYLILVVLIVLFCVEYFFQQNFIAPTSLLILSFIMAVSVIIINIDDWDAHFCVRFALCIFITLFSFIIGVVFVRFLAGPCVSYNSSEISRRKERVMAGDYPVTFMALSSLVCTLLYLYVMIRRVGVYTSFSAMLRAIYDNALIGSTSDFFLHQFLEIAIAISKINFFEIMVRKYIKREKRISFILLIPLVCFLMCMVVSTDRNIFLRFVLYCLCLWIMFYSYTATRTKSRTNWEILKKALSYVLLLVVLFFGLGKLKNYTSNFHRMIGIYAGSGLYNFNLFIENFDGSSLQYGNSTFSTFQNLLRVFGLLGGEAERTATHGDFITYLSSTGYVYSSNIYSAMRPYVEDFGYIGLIIYPLILGVFFECLYLSVQKRPLGFSWVLYSLLMYSIVYFSVTEQFFQRFHLGLVYEVGWTALLFFIIYGCSRMRIKRSVI